MLASCIGLFTSCIRPTPSGGGSKPLDYTPGYRIHGCIFCDVSKEKGFDVVWEDDAFVAFNDRNPSAAYHILVIPKRHVESVKTLVPSDASMVQRMAEIGHDILDGFNVPRSSRRFGFHIPPYNSVNHLHLHVHGLPYKSLWRRAKYSFAPGRKGKEKGFSWFVEVEQAIRILESGGSVGVMPC